MYRAFKDLTSRVGPGADTGHGDNLWWPQATSSEGQSRQTGADYIHVVPTESKHDKWLMIHAALQSCNDNDHRDMWHLDSCSSRKPTGHHHGDTNSDELLQQFRYQGASSATQQATTQEEMGQRSCMGLNGEHGGDAPRLNSIDVICFCLFAVSFKCHPSRLHSDAPIPHPHSTSQNAITLLTSWHEWVQLNLKPICIITKLSTLHLSMKEKEAC